MGNSTTGLDSLRECIERARGPLPRGCAGYQLTRITVPVDMYETKTHLVLEVFIPGFNMKEVNTSISGDTITISGEHKEKTDVEGAEYYCKEHRYGSFERKMAIPIPVKRDKIETTLSNGVYKLRLLKEEV